MQALSQFPQCVNDMSFWVPTGGINSVDFYEIVRNIGGDIVEQVIPNIRPESDEFWFEMFLFLIRFN